MEAGEVLQGAYILERFVGRGAQGECWLVREGEQLWLAKIYRLFHEGWEPYAQVEREATILRQLDHPGIPTVRDHFMLPDGPLLCMLREWIPGDNLETCVEARRFSEEDVRGLATQLLELLCYIHGLSPAVIHRDIKPSNIILKPDQSLSLIDFGSVRDALYQNEGASVVGTFGYTPPEQFMGHPTPASDLYALGATLVYLLARQHPSTLPISHNRLQFEAYINVQPRFLRILQRLLAPSVEERFSTAQEALDAVVRCSSLPAAPPVSPPAEAPGQLEASAPSTHPKAWQRHRFEAISWQWERPSKIGVGATHPPLKPLIETLQKRFEIEGLDEFSDPLELVQAVDARFGPEDPAGRRLILRQLHPYDAADILLGFYTPECLFPELTGDLLERFSLLFTHAPDNAIGQWVLLYFLHKHGWRPQADWHGEKQLVLPIHSLEMLGWPRRLQRFIHRFGSLPIGKQAKDSPRLMEHWQAIDAHFRLCCKVRPPHLEILVKGGVGRFAKECLASYSDEFQRAWLDDRLLRWTLRSLTSWPPPWLSGLLKRDARKYNRLGAYVATVFDTYAALDQMRTRLHEEYHWLLPKNGEPA